jgi:hypothetical protein
MGWRELGFRALAAWILISPFAAAGGDPIRDMQLEIENEKAQPPPPLRPKFIAISFSKRCLKDSCGDGSFGVGVSSDLAEAQRRAADACAANTKRQGSCGLGGAWPACRTDDKESWAALALYDDYRESLTDGEGIGYPTEASASEAALANCAIGLHACRVVWSQQIMCPAHAHYGAVPLRNRSSLAT